MKKLILIPLMLLAGCHSATTPAPVAAAAAPNPCQKPMGEQGPTVCDAGPVLWFSSGILVDKRLFQKPKEDEPKTPETAAKPAEVKKSK